ncbi:Kelch domain-containing protein 3 [Varanus komodoensis]|nr:Kelch domain-containing protein 3 [Varanus komodoensis]
MEEEITTLLTKFTEDTQVGVVATIEEQVIQIQKDQDRLWKWTGDNRMAFNGIGVTGTHKWFTPKVSGMVPGARDGHSACVLGKSMYIFGGYEQLADCFSNDIHKLDSSNMMWSLICTKAPKASETATLNPPPFTILFSNFKMLALPLSSLISGTPSMEDTHLVGYNGELYIFGGYNARLNRHFHDLWKFDPVSSTWKRIDPKGKGPCPRRRQCCCRVGDKIILFGGTSPSPEEGIGDEFDLMDHSDLYILDFSPSLKTLCKLAVIQYNLDQSCLPHDIRWELAAMTTNSNISRPIFSSHG